MTQLWVISAVKGRGKKREREKRKTYLLGEKKKIRKHQPGRKPKEGGGQSQVNECFKKMGRISVKC